VHPFTRVIFIGKKRKRIEKSGRRHLPKEIADVLYVSPGDPASWLLNRREEPSA
jgi:hypothetical protein